MSALRDAAERLGRAGRFPTWNADRKLEIEKAVTRLQGRTAGQIKDAEPWDDFLRRIGLIDG